ncbi:COG4223 family protein [Celeribacter sp.]|uniref:COG4223 family protein n=1 Tax=Celeribacter sp. TaxID=1890673 RepID=UPI003A8EEBAD
MARKKKSTSDPKPVEVEDQAPKSTVVEETPVEGDGIIEESADDAARDEEHVDAVEGSVAAEPDDTDAVPVDEAPAPVVADAVAAKKGGFVPALLGGVICLGLGYAGAQFIKPEGWPFPGANTSEITARVEALQAEIAALKSDTSKLSDDLAGTRTSLEGQIKTEVAAIDLNARIAPLSENLVSLEERLNTVEARPVQEAIVSPEATAAYERQLSEMRTLLDSEVSRLKDAKDAAQAEERAATAATALASLKTAIDSGAPYADLLVGIEIDIPDGIRTAAETGVSAISALKETFDPAAREALTAAARASYDEGTQGWFETFTRTQLGLRSLAPKEGDSADAILSRARADVTDADFAAALSELENLPEAGRTAMADWIAKASARVAVTDALQSMLGQ